MRDHVEFIQSQNVMWEDAADFGFGAGVRVKQLSHDKDSDALTCLVSYPQGFAAEEARWQDVPEEIYLLDGQLAIGGDVLGRHGYLYLPAGTPRRPVASPEGALALVFRHEPSQPRKDDPQIMIDTPKMGWDMSINDPNLTHLQMGRKVLRMGPGGSGRTWLLAGFPQSTGAVLEVGLERHPHAEEMFLIHGEMGCGYGVMTTGAYFYRPPDIWHGLHTSEFGFFMILRTPGANEVVTEWSKERHKVPTDPPYRPILPPDAPPSLKRPRPARPDY